MPNFNPDYAIEVYYSRKSLWTQRLARLLLFTIDWLWLTIIILREPLISLTFSTSLRCRLH